ncbi:MAG: response regulator [Candidatus Omnitrophica bacterium]|nr:response regulator [Candidatus Omnitrophota bacterium]
MSKKILIVDDSPTFLATLQAALKDEDFNLVTAVNGEEGAKLAISEKPDLAIIDTLLPGINGFDTCSKIRKVSTNANLKILIITGSVDAIDAVKARKSGADDYCVKTKDIKLIIDSAKKLLG